MKITLLQPAMEATVSLLPEGPRALRMGMDDESLMQDYELTSFSIWGWRRRDSELFGKLVEALNQWGAPEEAMRVKVERFLLEGGVTPEQIETIRSIFLI